MTTTETEREHTANKPKTLRGGVTPHKLTTEERRRGAQRTNELRREAAKSFSQKIAEKMEEHADELIKCFLDAAKAGDWRAAAAMIERVLGKPDARLTLEGGERAIEVDFTFSSAEQQQTQAIVTRALEPGS